MSLYEVYEDATVVGTALGMVGVVVGAVYGMKYYPAEKLLASGVYGSIGGGIGGAVGALGSALYSAYNGSSEREVAKDKTFTQEVFNDAAFSGFTLGAIGAVAGAIGGKILDSQGDDFSWGIPGYCIGGTIGFLGGAACSAYNHYYGDHSESGA